MYNKTYSDDKSLTLDEALAVSGINYDVGRFPAYAKIGDRFVEVPHRNFTARMDTDYVFDAVGADYNVVQNREGFSFLYDLVDAGELVLEQAWELYGGRKVAIVTKRPEHILIGGLEVANYIVWTTSHDGKGSSVTFGLQKQLICGNQLASAQTQAGCKYRVRHTKNSRHRLADARKAMQITFKQTEELQKTAERLMGMRLDRDFYTQAIKDISGVSGIDKEKQKKAYSNAMGTARSIHGILRDAEYIENYRNTRWGLYQAVTDHLSNVKKYTSERRKFEVLSSGHPMMNKAYQILTTA
jgi:phage/plasmid-like protein (TIGR03299 family)